MTPFHLRSFRVLAMLLTFASQPLWALEAAPYSRDAHARLERASGSFEPPTGGDVAQQAAALMGAFRKIYEKAGYSFEKSLMRYLDELERDGRPPLVREAEIIQQAYVVTLGALEQGVTPERLFPSRGDEAIRARLSKLQSDLHKEAQLKAEVAKAEEARRQHEEATAATNRQLREEKRIAAAAAAVDDKRRADVAAASSWASKVQGRYRHPSNPETVFELSYVHENVYRISGERSQQSAFRNQPPVSCKVPPTEIAMEVRHEKLLVGHGQVAGCELAVNVHADGKISLSGGSRSAACDALCTAGKWVSLTLDSETLRPQRRTR